MTGFAIVLRKRPAELDRLIQRMCAQYRAVIFFHEEIMTGREPTVVIRTTDQRVAEAIKKELSEYA